VSTAAAATAVSTTAAAAAATTTLGGLVDADCPAVKVGTVELALSCGCAVAIGERHEAEASGAAGVAVGNDLGISDLTERLKVGSEGGVISGPSETTYEKLITHICPVTLKNCIPPIRFEPESEVWRCETPRV